MAARKPATKKKKKKKTARRPRSASRAIREPEQADVTALDSALDPVAIKDAVAVLDAALDAFRDRLAAVADEGEVPQALVAIAALAQEGKGVVGSIDKLFTVNALRLRSGGGSFASGAYRVDFDSTKGQRKVAWKDVAVENRRLLCAARGEAFDGDQYAESVLTNTKPKPGSIKVVIREDR